MLKWNRRQFLSGLLTAASAGAATSAPILVLQNLAATTQPTATAQPTATTQPTTTTQPTATAHYPSARLDDGASHILHELLPEGLSFGRWRVVSVLPVNLGAVPVVLESRRGERFQVDVLRRDRSARARRGISETHKYSLFLFNRGQGDTPTQEDHGLAVLWLAAFLRPRERLHNSTDLLTQHERTQRFPRGKFNALVTGTAPRQATDEPSVSQATRRLSMEPERASLRLPLPRRS